MKCEQGDLAKIIYSLRPNNLGKTVLVVEYIGKFTQGESFQFKGIECKAPINDHYWWISTEFGLSNMYGDTPKAYIADSWLDPIRPEKQIEKVTEKIDIFEKM